MEMKKTETHCYKNLGKHVKTSCIIHCTLKRKNTNQVVFCSILKLRYTYLKKKHTHTLIVNH